jgi:hypothetical protein
MIYYYRTDSSAQAFVQAQRKTLEKDHTVDDNQKHIDIVRILEPWNWKTHTVPLLNLGSNDILVMCGKVTTNSSDASISEEEINSKSSICVQNCTIHVSRVCGYQ